MRLALEGVSHLVGVDFNHFSLRLSAPPPPDSQVSVWGRKKKIVLPQISWAMLQKRILPRNGRKFINHDDHYLLQWAQPSHLSSPVGVIALCPLILPGTLHQLFLTSSTLSTHTRKMQLSTGIIHKLNVYSVTADWSYHNTIIYRFHTVSLI